MTADIIIVYALIVLAVILFASERLPFGLTAAMVLVILVLTGVLTPEEGFSGFSSRATMAIGAMFMLSEGVRRTGLLDRVGELLVRVVGRRPRGALLGFMVVIGVISAFINNTAAVAIFIPVILSVSGRLQVSPSRMLMPASFAAMFGGACTLLGTSTNILVSEVAEKHGQPGLGMFELSGAGLVFLALGLTYLLTLGPRLLPDRRPSADMEGGYRMQGYLTEVVVEPEGDLVGTSPASADLLSRPGLEVIAVTREGQEVSGPLDRIRLRAADVLRLHGKPRDLARLVEDHGLSLKVSSQGSLEGESGGDRVLVEAVVVPDSPLARRRLREIDLAGRFGAQALAIQHRGRLEREDLDSLRLTPGDCLLLSTEADRVAAMEKDPSIALVSRAPRPTFRTGRMPAAVLTVVAVVVATALDVAPVAINALAGVIVMVLTGCLNLEEGIQAVNWEVILLLGGLIPLGLAMEKTGAALVLVQPLSGFLAQLGPRAVISGLFLLTMLLTSVVNNQAAAVLLAPVAFEIAGELDLAVRPLLVAVAFGASLSFLTPVSYQTNTMVYGPGQYRFGDYFRVGIGLNLLLWALGSFLIPAIWPPTV